jgi:hypothetical protein
MLDSKKLISNHKSKTQFIMRKVLYIIILAIITSASVTSCTEQEVKPNESGTGGTPSDPKG